MTAAAGTVLSHSDHFVLNLASLAPGVFEITYSPFMLSKPVTTAIGSTASTIDLIFPPALTGFVSLSARARSAQNASARTYRRYIDQADNLGTL